MQSNSIQSRVWAHLVGRGLSYRVVDMPDGSKREQGLTRQQSDAIVNSVLDDVVDDIVMSNPWDFAVDVATLTVTAGTAAYTLDGNDSDCRDIVDLRYGSTNKKLREYDFSELDRRLSDVNTSSLTSVYGFVQYGRSTDDFPKITIYNTPTESTTGQYRYHKKGVGIAALPGYFAACVTCGVLKLFDPGYEAKYEHELNKLIDRHTPGGDEYAQIPRDPQFETNNKRRTGLMGGA